MEGGPPFILTGSVLGSSPKKALTSELNKLPDPPRGKHGPNLRDRMGQGQALEAQPWALVGHR